MRIGIGLAFLAAVTLSTAARASVIQEFKAEDWDGLAFTSDETGKFTHCSVYATYQNGSTLYISYEVGDTWFFSVANDSWTLKEGDNFDIKFKVDRRGEIEGTGTALGPTQIGLPVEADHAFVGQLRRGNRLVISFQDNDYAFELSNSNKAMNAAQDCVRRHVRLGTHTDVVAGSPEDPAPPQESQQAEQETPAEPATADPPASTDAEPPAAAAGEQQQFGPWVVTATDDGNGNFVNCTAYGVQGDDQLILSYFPDTVWTFGLYRPAWNLDTNQTYYFWYNVDGPADAQGVVKRPVEAAEPTRIFFEVSDVEDIVERIENGTTLNIQFRGVSGAAETFSYSLDQAHAAFEATRKCVTDHATGGTEVETQPSAGESVSKEETGGKQEGTGTEPNADTTEGSPNRTLSDQEMAGIPELGAKQIENLEVPGWKAAAFSLDDGTFTHCGIKAEYQNGATLGFARAADGDLILAIQHQDWSLAADSRVPMTYDLTGNEPLSITADSYAATNNLILSNMGNEGSVTETVRNAPQITIEAEGKELSFDITDIAPGITAIDECVARHLAEPHLPAPKKPAAKKAELSPEPNAGDDAAEVLPIQPDALPQEDVASLESPSDPAAIRTEAAGYTTALLFRAGYPNHIILGTDAEIPDAVPPGEAAWELGEVKGSTKIVSAGTPDDIKSSVGGYMLGKCGGGILDTQVIDSDATHMHFSTKCKASDPATHFVVLPRDAGGSYLFGLLGAVDDTAAGSIAEAVYRKAIGG